MNCSIPVSCVMPHCMCTRWIGYIGSNISNIVQSSDRQSVRNEWSLPYLTAKFSWNAFISICAILTFIFLNFRKAGNVPFAFGYERMVWMENIYSSMATCLFILFWVICSWWLSVTVYSVTCETTVTHGVTYLVQTESLLGIYCFIYLREE